MGFRKTPAALRMQLQSVQSTRRGLAAKWTDDGMGGGDWTRERSRLGIFSLK